MSEEIMKVLVLLDEGKISAGEAEKLIEVLKPARNPRAPRMQREFVTKLERIPEIISKKLEQLNIDQEINKVKREFFGKEGKTRFDDIQKLVVNEVQGDVVLVGTKNSFATMTTEGSVPKVVRGKKSVVINHSRGDLEVRTPMMAKVVLQSMSGDATISGLQGGFTAQLYSGDLSGSFDGGKIAVNSYSGDVNCTVRKDTDARVVSYSGDIDLEVSADLNVEIFVEMQAGDFENQTANEEMEHDGNFKIKFGDGSSKIHIQSYSGDVSISEYIADELDEPQEPEAPEDPELLDEPEDIDEIDEIKDDIDDTDLC